MALIWFCCYGFHIELWRAKIMFDAVDGMAALTPSMMMQPLRRRLFPQEGILAGKDVAPGRGFKIN